MNKANSQNFLIVFALILFSLGLFIGKESEKVDQDKRVAEIVSCSEYDEDFLKTLGFQSRKDCSDLNIALHKQYLDSCSRQIKTTSREDYNLKLLNSCVYHYFESNSIFMNSEYFAYKKL